MSQDKTTIRMRRAPDSTLHGYVFRDWHHAREWLSASWIIGRKADKIKLEVVIQGEAQKCKFCFGSGYESPVTKISDISLSEVLAAPCCVGQETQTTVEVDR